MEGRVRVVWVIAVEFLAFALMQSYFVQNKVNLFKFSIYIFFKVINGNPAYVIGDRPVFFSLKKWTAPMCLVILLVFVLETSQQITKQLF